MNTIYNNNNNLRIKKYNKNAYSLLEIKVELLEVYGCLYFISITKFIFFDISYFYDIS
jgi:hypothetical protein